MNLRKCAFCGEEFIPNSSYQKYCKRPHYRLCPICGRSYVENNVEKLKRPPTTCSMECRVKKTQKTSLEKYGIKAPGNNPEAREKSKETMNERYGVDYAQQSSEIRQKSIDTFQVRYGVDNPQKNEAVRIKTEQTNIARYRSKTYLTSDVGRETIRQTMISRYGTTVPLRNAEIKTRWVCTNFQKYGVDTPSKNEQVKQKRRNTSLIRYGTPYPQSSDIVKKQIKETFIRNYGVDNCSKSEEIINKIRQTFFDRYHARSVMQVEDIADRIRRTNIDRYGVPYYVMLPNVAKSSGRISKINKSVKQKLDELEVDSTLEFSLERQSYDIYIPQGKILLEIDPSYTHSTAGNHWNTKGIHKFYHLRKSIIAQKHGYRCIHLWDWDSIPRFLKSLVVKNVIYFHDEPKELTHEVADDFISRYSMYSIPNDIRRTIFIGIYYKTKLICMMGFRNVDIILKKWEIVCVEHRFGYNIYNGYIKIFTYFLDKYKPNSIIGYADYSKSNGELLEELGFNQIDYTLPNKIWSKGRHAIVDDSNIIPEAMLEDNWLPVYNCGYKVYEYCPNK